MSKNEQIHGENAKLTSELLHKHNKMEQKHNQLMTIHATLRKESSRDQLSGERSTKQLAQTVKILEERLSHIKTPVTLSIIGCVVNGPGEAAMTDVGITGGGKGNNRRKRRNTSQKT